MPNLNLHLLGGFRAETPAGRTLVLPTEKITALLAYLALAPDQPHRREKLAGLLWPEWTDAESLRNLRQSLYRLRQSLEQAAPGLFEALCTVSRTEVSLHSAAMSSDAADFWRALALPSQHGHTSLSACPTCRTAVAAAVESYQGEFLAGLALADAPEFETWLADQRQRHHLAFLGALADLAESALSLGDFSAAHAYAARQLALEPWRELAHRQAMRALLGLGLRGAAIEQFHRCRTALAEELGVDPEPQTATLYQALLEPEDSFAAPGTPPPATAPPATAPLATPPPVLSRPARIHLPTPLSSFVGRQDELSQLGLLLQRNRLLTLTGPGGSGKTRLAVESGRSLLASFGDGVGDGVVLVELADLTDPARVAHAIAQRLGVDEQEGHPLAQLLADFLAPRRLLLILDNCEHLLTAAATTAEFLLAHCPGVQILATSREPLGVTGEQVYPVSPLPLPEIVSPVVTPADVQSLADVPAVRLFVERAVAQRPDFALAVDNAGAVVEICRRLDGMPLALELAAARVRALAPARIAELLDERFALLTSGSRTALPRQQTLRALIDWSYDLLSPAEQCLFRRMAVFAGGASLEGLEAICADRTAGAGRPSVEGETVLDLLLRLVDKSMVLVRADGAESRYGMLESIRAYALERLQETGEDEQVALCHARYYADLAAQAEMELVGGDEFGWLERLGKEDDNLRAALQWAFGGGEKSTFPRLQLGIQLTGCVAYYWDAKAQLDDSHRWLGLAWDSIDKRTLPADQARLASGLGTLAWRRGRYSEACTWHQRAVHLYQQAEDEWGLSFALHNLGIQYDQMGDWNNAHRLLQESIRVAEAGDHSGMLAMGLSSLGTHAVSLQDYEMAGPLLEQAVVLLRARHSLRMLGYVLTSLLEYQLATGRVHLGWATIAEMEVIASRCQDISLMGAIWTSRARMLRFEGRKAEALAASAEGVRPYRDILPGVYFLEVLESFILSLVDTGRFSAGLFLLAFCDKHRLIEQDARPPVYQTEVDAGLVLIRSALSAADFAAISAQAEALTIQGALAYALLLADEPDAPLPSMNVQRQTGRIAEIQPV